MHAGLLTPPIPCSLLSHNGPPTSIPTASEPCHCPLPPPPLTVFPPRNISMDGQLLEFSQQPPKGLHLGGALLLHRPPSLSVPNLYYFNIRAAHTDHLPDRPPGSLNWNPRQVLPLQVCGGLCVLGGVFFCV